MFSRDVGSWAHENGVNTSHGQWPLVLTRWANVCMKLVSDKSWMPWASWSEGEIAYLASIARRKGHRRSVRTIQALAPGGMTHGAHHSAGSTLPPPSTLFTMPFKPRATVVNVCRMATGLCPSICVNASGWAAKEPRGPVSGR
jgi:hypothetical protein